MSLKTTTTKITMKTMNKQQLWNRVRATCSPVATETVHSKHGDVMATWTVKTGPTKKDVVRRIRLLTYFTRRSAVSHSQIFNSGTHIFERKAL